MKLTKNDVSGYKGAMMTPAQSRAARGLLGWTQADLASAAKVGVVTVRQFESSNAEPRSATLTVIRGALEAVGVLFIPEDHHGPGVRLQNSGAIEDAVRSLLALQATADDLSQLETLVREFSDDDRGVLAQLFGNRFYFPSNRPSDPRAHEIIERLTRTGDFRG